MNVLNMIPDSIQTVQAACCQLIMLLHCILSLLPCLQRVLYNLEEAALAE